MDLAAARFERERLARLGWAWNGSTSRNICGVSVACTAYAATGIRWIATRNLDRFILPRRRDARLRLVVAGDSGSARAFPERIAKNDCNPRHGRLRPIGAGYCL